MIYNYSFTFKTSIPLLCSKLYNCFELIFEDNFIF